MVAIADEFGGVAPGSRLAIKSASVATSIKPTAEALRNRQSEFRPAGAGVKRRGFGVDAPIPSRLPATRANKVPQQQRRECQAQSHNITFPMLAWSALMAMTGPGLRRHHSVHDERNASSGRAYCRNGRLVSRGQRVENRRQNDDPTANHVVSPTTSAMDAMHQPM